MFSAQQLDQPATFFGNVRHGGGRRPGALAAAEISLDKIVNQKSATQIRFQTVRLDLKHAWIIARGTAAFKENVFVWYEREGLTGIGEAGHLTAANQTAAQTTAGLEKLQPLYTAANPLAYQEVAQAAVALPDVSPPARAALEMALLDWVGQQHRLPLYRLFGLDAAKTAPTSFSIGLDTPEAMKEKVRETSAYAILKVKLGGNEDEAIIKTLRSVSVKPIRVDANEGWADKETAIRKIEWLEKQGIELVEQPLPRRMIEENAWLKARTRLPLIADEAVHTAKDILGLAGAFTGVNIKLMKSGGLLEALRMFTLARSLDMETMLGCMIESSVAITAAVHLQSLARWVDLDGCLLLKADPYEGAGFKDGHWVPPDRPGLGIREKK